MVRRGLANYLKGYSTKVQTKLSVDQSKVYQAPTLTKDQPTMQDFWNSRYATDGFAYGTAPNDFLASKRDLLPPTGTALAIADGEGRNGVWLAKQGLDVTTVDFAQPAVDKALNLARENSVDIKAVCADLTKWNWPAKHFDVVVSIFAHFPPPARKTIHRGVLQALKPGGLLILEAYRPAQLALKTGGPPTTQAMYSAKVLGQDFGSLDLLELAEVTADISEGRYHTGPGAVTRLVGRKPTSG